MSRGTISIGAERPATLDSELGGALTVETAIISGEERHVSYDWGMEHGWITTLRRDGSPRSARVWFAEASDAIWVASGETTLKVADIRRDPRVTFAIEGRHRAVSARASIVPLHVEPAIQRLLAARYEGWDAADTTVDGVRVFIRIATR